MAWSVEFSRTSKRQFARIDHAWQRRILDYLEDEISNLDDPRSRGRPLSGNLTGLWRYRIGDYRAICDITDASMTILVLQIGHRKSIYR